MANDEVVYLVLDFRGESGYLRYMHPLASGEKSLSVAMPFFDGTICNRDWLILKIYGEYCQTTALRKLVVILPDIWPSVGIELGYKNVEVIWRLMPISA